MNKDTEIRQRLIVLFQEMADHTKPECAHTCLVPFSCCDSMYCGMATEYAQKEWGVDLTPLRTGHEKLPYMSEKGCTVPPHLRPLCSLHTCAINGLGEKRGDPAWNKKYFKLREEINELEESRSY